MKRLVQSLFAFCAALAVLSAFAAPLKRADVSANPVWVLHVDCDALRQTYIGKYLLYHLDKPEMNSNMVAFQSIFSFDLRTQLHGVTFYSESLLPQDNIGIVYADFNPDRVIKLVTEADAPQIITNNQQVIYSWINKKKNAADNDRPRNYAGIQRGFLVLGKNKERVVAALAVVNQNAPNLLSTEALPELGAANDSAFVQAGARRLDFLGPDANMALLKMARRAKFRASEADDRLTAVATLEVGDDAKAKQMFDLVHGLIALLRMQKNNPKAVGLADGLIIKQEGGTLTATFAVPSADLIAAIKTYGEQKEKPLPESK